MLPPAPAIKIVLFPMSPVPSKPSPLPKQYYIEIHHVTQFQIKNNNKNSPLISICTVADPLSPKASVTLHV